MTMYKLSAIEIRDAFLKGKFSAVEITDYFLKRISSSDPKIKAFLSLFEERARKRAKELDLKKAKKEPLGKLAAIPVAVKDNTNVKGEITSCASKFLQNYRALFDSTATALIEKEDGILFGKTNLDEFSMGSSTEKSAFFPTHNPWDLSCSPGGSSGGSSAAVAARLVPLAIGSDTGGSIRQPAALSGVAGFKPTYGRVSRYGLVAFASSLDQIGPIAQSALDAGLLMEVIGRHCDKDSTSLNLPPEIYTDTPLKSLNDIVIGIPWAFLKNLKEPAQKNFKEALQTLSSLGAKLVDVNLDILKYSIAIYYILATAEASTNLARFDGIKYGVRSSSAKSLDEIYDLSREEGFGPEVKRRIMLGTYVLSSGYEEAYYKKAQKVKRLFIKAYEEAFEKCDFIVMPTAPSTAFEIGAIRNPIEMYYQDIFTIGVNIAKLPAISINSGFDEKPKPFGLQFIGPIMHDILVIKIASLFERETGFWKKVPPLFDKELK